MYEAGAPQGGHPRSGLRGRGVTTPPSYVQMIGKGTSSQSSTPCATRLLCRCSLSCESNFCNPDRCRKSSLFWNSVFRKYTTKAVYPEEGPQCSLKRMTGLRFSVSCSAPFLACSPCGQERRALRTREVLVAGRAPHRSAVVHGDPAPRRILASAPTRSRPPPRRPRPCRLSC